MFLNACLPLMWTASCACGCCIRNCLNLPLLFSSHIERCALCVRQATLSSPSVSNHSYPSLGDDDEDMDIDDMDEDDDEAVSSRVGVLPVAAVHLLRCCRSACLQF